MNKAEFLQVLETLTDFYDKTPPKKQLEAWYWKIKHLDFGVAREAADEVTSHLAMFPTPAKFLEFANNAQARVASRARTQDHNQARAFFEPAKHDPGFARDCVQAINDLLSTPKNDARVFQKTKYETAKRMLDKYPSMTEDAKAPLKAMMREAKDDFRKLMDVEEAKSAEAVQ